MVLHTAQKAAATPQDAGDVISEQPFMQTVRFVDPLTSTVSNVYPEPQLQEPVKGLAWSQGFLGFDVVVKTPPKTDCGWRSPW